MNGPCPHCGQWHNGYCWPFQPHMQTFTPFTGTLTKREEFAMAMLASARNPTPCLDHAASARWAIAEADALLAELDKEQTP